MFLAVESIGDIFEVVRKRNGDANRVQSEDMSYIPMGWDPSRARRQRVNRVFRPARRAGQKRVKSVPGSSPCWAAVIPHGLDIPQEGAGSRRTRPGRRLPLISEIGNPVGPRRFAAPDSC